MLQEISYQKLVSEMKHPVLFLKDGRILSLEELFSGVRCLIDINNPAQVSIGVPVVPAQPKPEEPEKPKEVRKRRSAKELEHEIIKAYNGGERTISQVMEIVGCTYATARRYLPINKEG